ncbi:hypothetical protein AYI68_g8072 [Smittium mucronatum]|uniref:Uncharacterized protein n=1 Tax=Smittium mucronatum TaxID=133383 RepID=A0A1R0GLY7_9FUNG|nr:hypothetical protein AYI68_g8072 [Smittium mucronatum]
MTECNISYQDRFGQSQGMSLCNEIAAFFRRHSAAILAEVTSLKTILKKYEKKKKSYRKDYYPNYSRLLCRNTGCVPTGKWSNLPTERLPPGIANEIL